MILYPMRHGNAGTIRENPILDLKRGLVAKARKDSMLMARVLGALKAPIDTIVSSSLKRALQTAQLVGTELGFDGKVEINPGLGLNASFLRFPGDAGEVCRPRLRVLAVGHNPNLFQFLGRLITGNGGGFNPGCAKAPLRASIWSGTRPRTAVAF